MRGIVGNLAVRPSVWGNKPVEINPLVKTLLGLVNRTGHVTDRTAVLRSDG